MLDLENLRDEKLLNSGVKMSIRWEVRFPMWRLCYHEICNSLGKNTVKKRMFLHSILFPSATAVDRAFLIPARRPGPPSRPSGLSVTIEFAESHVVDRDHNRVEHKNETIMLNEQHIRRGGWRKPAHPGNCETKFPK